MHYEKDYLALVKKIIEIGNPRNDRTGTGTRSLFGEKLELDLTEDRMPLLTTKKIDFEKIKGELLWFISGSTNLKELQDKFNVHIWDANAKQDGTLGPIYGHQWRKIPENDQLLNALQLIKNDPHSRRILVSAWNVSQLKDMALPPCHALFQFFVNTEQKTLSCQMYQRSADMGLGVPYNMASYALLTHVMAHLSGLKAERLIICFGDCHVYNDHIEPLKRQLEREPRSKHPRIKLSDKLVSLDNIDVSFIELYDYDDPHPGIKMKMSV